MAAKKPPNHGKPWTPKDDRTLHHPAKGTTPMWLIRHNVGRTEDAVRSHASEAHVSLRPANQSPHNRRKK